MFWRKRLPVLCDECKDNVLTADLGPGQVIELHGKCIKEATKLLIARMPMICDACHRDADTVTHLDFSSTQVLCDSCWTESRAALRDWVSAHSKHPEPKQTNLPNLQDSRMEEE